MAHNEAIFLPIWLKYYKQYFDDSDIYIIDHDTTDGSTDGIKNVERVTSGGIYDNQFMVDNVIRKQHELLKTYYIVVYSDADEIVLADPNNYTGLDDYLDRFEYDKIGCNSRSVVQQATEPAIDLTKPILSQRSVWFEEYLYNKTLVSRVPLRWSKGIHTPIDDNDKPYSVPIDEDLILLHLARMDYGLRQERGHSFAAERWDGEGDDAKQQRLVDEELKHWFYYPSRVDFIELIPERFKALV